MAVKRVSGVPDKLKEKVAEKPAAYMDAMAKELHPDSIRHLDYKKLRNHLQLATFIINEHADKLGEKKGEYAGIVESAKEHFRDRITERKKMAGDMAAKLDDYGSPLSPEEIEDIESSIGEMRVYLGLPDAEEQSLREKLGKRKEHETVSRREKPDERKGDGAISQKVDSLSLYFHDMNGSKLNELRSVFNLLNEQHPGHPAVIELGKKLERAEKLVNEQEMRGEIEKYLPADAKPHLATLINKLKEVETEEGSLEEASEKLLVAVNSDALKGMGKSIAPEDFEKSRRALEYVKLVHEIVGADSSHLERFENLLEKAEKYIPKK